MIWQSHACETPIFPDRQTSGDFSDWGGRFHLPRFQLTIPCLILPNWREVRSWVESIPSRLMLLTSHVSAHTWRQLPLGRDESQLRILPTPGALPTHALTHKNRRLSAKTHVPSWAVQAREDDAWRNENHPGDMCSVGVWRVWLGAWVAYARRSVFSRECTHAQCQHQCSSATGTYPSRAQSLCQQTLLSHC